MWLTKIGRITSRRNFEEKALKDHDIQHTSALHTMQHRVIVEPPQVEANQPLHTVAQKTVPMFGHFVQTSLYHNNHLVSYFQINIY